MSRDKVRCLAIVGIAAICTAPIASGQTHSGVTKQPSRSLGPRTPDGRPDLQGTWTNSTATPFERPPELAGRAVLSAELAAQLERRAEEFRTHASVDASDVGHDNEEYIDRDKKVASSMQASIVIDPTDGRVPVLPDAVRQRDVFLENYDNYETMSPWDRCITRGPVPLIPAYYNAGYQIVQTPQHIVILAEMIHEARVIPIDGGPHADPRERSWAGDSRGRWEGDTLIVDTTNFNGGSWLLTHIGAGRLRGIPYSASLHTIERFTRTDANTIDYQMTIDDPEIFEGPWTVSLPMTRDDSYQIFEYACHEGNRAVELIMRGARAEERVAPKRGGR
jgi:hypothetical protein